VRKQEYQTGFKGWTGFKEECGNTGEQRKGQNQERHF
jgi:hypothetical protein